MDGDDGALLDAWRGGDRKAGKTLFERYYAPVERFFRNKLDESALPDIIQATFLACVEGRERIRGDGAFRAYLFGVAHNQLRKHYRDKRGGREDAVDFDEVSVADLAPTMSQILAARHEQRLLLEALRRIPLDCQEVLELHYWEQMSTEEIGEIVGVPAGTVKSRLQRGRRLLEEKLRRLAASAELLESTLANLDQWAKDLRERVLGQG